MSRLGLDGGGELMRVQMGCTRRLAVTRAERRSLIPTPVDRKRTSRLWQRRLSRTWARRREGRCSRWENAAWVRSGWERRRGGS